VGVRLTFCSSVNFDINSLTLGLPKIAASSSIFKPVIFLFLGGLDFLRSGVEPLLLWEPSLAVIVGMLNPETLHCVGKLYTVSECWTMKCIDLLSRRFPERDGYVVEVSQRLALATQQAGRRRIGSQLLNGGADGCRLYTRRTTTTSFRIDHPVVAPCRPPR
jgi:hypothetical protein